MAPKEFLHMKARLIRPIVSIEAWLDDEFYVGPEAPFIRPYVREFLVEYFHGTRRDVLCTGASRTGKSYAVRLLIMRILYEMSCYENFPCLFGLSPSTLPKIIWFSFTKGKSTTTGLDGLIRMIDRVPYFQDPGLRRRDVQTEIAFPFATVMSGSNVTHAIGEDLLGAIIDEANVRRVASGHEVEEAQKMFMEIRQRSVMTFSTRGVWGGFSGIISSSGTTTSFTAQRLEKARQDGSSVIMECSVYRANPEQYSRETFDVFTGNGTIPAFIVDAVDTSTRQTINGTYGMTVEQFLEANRTLVEPVPCSIRSFYEEDLPFSLMNMSGITQTGTNFFITDRRLIQAMFEGEHPGYEQTPCLGIYDKTSVYSLFDEDRAMSAYHGENVYIHVDPSQKWDMTGFSALYMDSEAHRIRSLYTTSFTINHDVPDNQIDQEKLLLLIKHLRDLGARIAFVSGDHYARDYLIPQCKLLLGNGCADYYSIDVSSQAFLTMLNYMKRGVYAVPHYGQLEYELQNLLYDRYTERVDHPHNTDGKHPVYFKDCADAFACASHHIYTMEAAPEPEHDTADDDGEPSDGFYEDIGYDTAMDDDDDRFMDSLGEPGYKETI